jgi:hypothetical protein
MKRQKCVLSKLIVAATVASTSLSAFAMAPKTESDPPIVDNGDTGIPVIVTSSRGGGGDIPSYYFPTVLVGLGGSGIPASGGDPHGGSPRSAPPTLPPRVVDKCNNAADKRITGDLITRSCRWDRVNKDLYGKALATAMESASATLNYTLNQDVYRSFIMQLADKFRDAFENTPELRAKFMELWEPEWQQIQMTEGAARGTALALGMIFLENLVNQLTGADTATKCEGTDWTSQSFSCVNQNGAVYATGADKQLLNRTNSYEDASFCDTHTVPSCMMPNINGIQPSWEAIPPNGPRPTLTW